MTVTVMATERDHHLTIFDLKYTWNFLRCNTAFPCFHRLNRKIPHFFVNLSTQFTMKCSGFKGEIVLHTRECFVDNRQV